MRIEIRLQSIYIKRMIMNSIQLLYSNDSLLMNKLKVMSYKFYPPKQNKKPLLL